MPRAGWLATGALLASQLPITGPWAAAGTGLTALLLLAAAGGALARRAGVAAFLIGAGVVGLRVALPAMVAPEPPVAPLASAVEGAWTAEVEAWDRRTAACNGPSCGSTGPAAFA